MFGIGIPELVLIAIVALVVVGPKRLPVTLRAVGRGIAEFRRALHQLRSQSGFDDVVDEVTRPLREGMAGIEADVRRFDDEDPYAVALAREYPEGGPDDMGALPETAEVYAEDRPETARRDATAGTEPVAPARALEGTVARGALDPDEQPEGSPDVSSRSPGV